jgi:MFS family permease
VRGSLGSVRRRWAGVLEPWYLAFVLLTIATTGLQPILLPLAVREHGGLIHAGLVVAAASLGAVTAAFWGVLADRLRWQRVLLVGGTLVVAVAFGGMVFATHLLGWIGLALLLGIGTAAANTIANLFVVEAHPRAEWSGRIAALQTCLTLGTMIGFVAAGAVSELPMDVGLSLAAALAALAAVVGLLTTHTPPHQPAPAERRADAVALHPEGGYSGVHHSRLLYLHWRHVDGAALRRVLGSPFGLLLASWVLATFGTGAVYALYPLMMQSVFGVPPSTSALALAVATGLSIAFFGPANRLVARFGASQVMLGSLVLRLVAMTGLVLLTEVVVPGLLIPGRGGPAVQIFVLLAAAWPFLSVSSTVLTSRLNPSDEGAAMGIYTAAAAVASLASAALAGAVAHVAGFTAVTALGMLLTGAGVLCALPLLAAVPREVPGPLVDRRQQGHTPPRQ